MTFIHLYLETFLDALAMFLLCSGIANHKIKFDKYSIYWFLLFQLYCIIIRLNFVIGGTQVFDLDFLNYDILPVNSIDALVFLMLSILVLNSLFFKLTNVGVVFTTILSFVLWIIIRIFSIVMINLFANPDLFYYVYLFRVLTVVLGFIFYRNLFAILLNSYILRKNIFTKIILVNTLIALLLLVVLTNFDTKILLKNIFYIAIALAFVIMINVWIVYEQRSSIKREKRMDVIEHYIPVIDELVSEVRVRQHEFDNKLLAITSIVETADDLNSVKEQIQMYTENVVMADSLKEVLLGDSKVISGFLYTKMKLAELKQLKMRTEIHANFRNLIVEEYEIVEVLGILLDNAIEACHPPDEIKVLINRVDGKIEIEVSHPHAFISNTRFLQMFEKGYTTKNKQSNTRGFGLYNVKQIVMQCGGKFITRNTEVNNRNYVTIGVKLP